MNLLIFSLLGTSFALATFGIGSFAMGLIGARRQYLGKAAEQKAIMQGDWCRRVAKRFGLRRSEDHHAMVMGTVDGFRVVAASGLGADGSSTVIVEVRGVPKGVWLTRQVQSSDDVKVGEKTFDDSVHAIGATGRVISLLDARTRYLVTRIFRESGEVAVLEQGTVRLEIPHADHRYIERAVGRGLMLATALRGDGAAEPERLAHIAMEDPIPRVREKALRALVNRWSREAPETKLAVKHGLRDEEPRVRLVAAQAAGNTSVMKAIANDQSLSGRMRCYGLRALAKHAAHTHNRKPLTLAVRRCLRRGSARLVKEAATQTAALVLHELRPTIELALRRRTGLHRWNSWSAAERTKRLPVVRELLNALVAIGVGPSQQEVLNLLTVPDTRVVHLVIDTLGSGADVGAVAPLLELAERGGLLSDTPGRARRAVRQIQARVGEVEMGALSLAKPRAGEGGLALVEPVAKQGRLSLLKTPKKGH